MASGSDRPLRRTSPAFLALAVLATLAGCVDGPSPVDPSGGVVVASLTVAPRLVPAPAPGEADPVNRIRVTARVVGSSLVVGQTVLDVDPGAEEWGVGIEVRVPAGANPQVLLTVELIHVAVVNGQEVEAVQWSGEAGPITVTPGGRRTVQSVEVGRGPTDNLTVTSVAIQGAPALVRIGRSAQLNATATATDPRANPQLFWASLDPGVGTVTEGGLFLGVSKGTARVVATAGVAADTVSIQVAPALSGVVVTPGRAELESFGEELTLAAQVLDTETNPVPSETVTWSSTNPQVLQSLGGGNFRAVGNGTAQGVATSTSEPTLSASATVVVRQKAAVVNVTPAFLKLTEIDRPAQFTAAAQDARQNPIADAAFEWVSTVPGVATVTQAGLATSVGGGLTTIQAWVLEPAAVAGRGSAGSRAPGDRTGVKGEATLEVELPYSVEVSPSTALLESLGATTRLFAFARNSSGQSVSAVFSWSSSDPTVATVDPTGQVTAVRDGTATVTATLSSVNPAAGGGGGPALAPPSASAVITVTQRAVALRWIVQPDTITSGEPFDPDPAVEAIDARGHRVTSFSGLVSIEAAFISPIFISPPGSAPGRNPGQEGPQRSPNYSSLNAVLGLAVFQGLTIENVFNSGRFSLTASAAGLASAVSEPFVIWGVE